MVPHQKKCPCRDFDSLGCCRLLKCLRTSTQTHQPFPSVGFKSSCEQLAGQGKGYSTYFLCLIHSMQTNSSSTMKLLGLGPTMSQDFAVLGALGVRIKILTPQRFKTSLKNFVIAQGMVLKWMGDSHHGRITQSEKRIGNATCTTLNPEFWAPCLPLCYFHEDK